MFIKPILVNIHNSFLVLFFLCWYLENYDIIYFINNCNISNNNGASWVGGLWVDIGTNFEYLDNLRLGLGVSNFYEVIKTDSTASQSQQDQKGNYWDSFLNIDFDYDKRNQKFQTTEGFRSRFTQNLPLISESYSLTNSYNFKLMLFSLSYPPFLGIWRMTLCFRKYTSLLVWIIYFHQTVFFSAHIY